MSKTTQPSPDSQADTQEEPQVFAVDYEAGKPAFTRKEFLELAAAASVAAAAIGCQISGATPVKRDPSPIPRLIDTLAPTAEQEKVATPPRPTQTPRPIDTAELQATDTPQPTDTPRPSSTPTMTATQAVAGRVPRGNINLRSGPGTYYDRIGVTKQDEKILVLSRTEDNAWLRIINSEDLDCWIAAEFVVLPGKVEDLPVETDIPPAPTGVPGTVPPGYTGINYTLDGKSYTLKCGAPLPPGAVCTCNCITVPGGCDCDGHSGDGGCDSVGPSGHYWYPS